MISIDKLLESKELFRTVFPTGNSFTWRLLTLKEYQVFSSLRDSETLSPSVVYEEVFSRCYCGDAELISEEISAGMTTSIGELILYLSGDCESETVKADIEAARANYISGSVREVMKRIVMTAFPSYTLEDIDSWTRPELFRKFTISEELLKERVGYEPFDVRKITTGEEKEKSGLNIDFDRENAAINQAMGAWAHENAPPAKRPPKTSVKKDEKNVSKKVARRLDRRRRKK